MVITPIIYTNFKSTLNCQIPKYSSCQISCSMKRNSGAIKQYFIPEKEAIIPWDIYEVVYIYLDDQFIVKNSGHLRSLYVCERSHLSFHGKTIFLYAATVTI